MQCQPLQQGTLVARAIHRFAFFPFALVSLSVCERSVVLKVLKKLYNAFKTTLDSHTVKGPKA
jgi:hypothetical protein